jgi:DNA processing protein
MTGACDACLRRTWLLGRLSAHLERERRRILELLALSDAELIVAVAGRERAKVAAEYERFAPADAAVERSRSAAAGLTLVCRCQERYPVQLRGLSAPPAVLHVFGDAERLLALEAGETVAIVGARRPSEYGRAVAAGLARGAAASGLAVVSGMALGIDAAVHEGALAAGGVGMTVAVLANSPHVAHPASRRRLHAQIAARGAVVSELGPGTVTRRWGFPARNRLIAGLAGATVVVEGRTGSGSLLTARAALASGRTLGAVPGNVTSELSAGPNALLVAGACVIRHPQDLLDMLFGAGVRPAPADMRPPPTGSQAQVLEAIAAGRDTPITLLRGDGGTCLGMERGELLVALTELELAGRVRRAAGGRLVVVP